jgi:hypothetical protein
VRRSSLFLVLAATAALALLAMLAGYLLLSTAWGRARIRDQINRSVSSAIQGQLQVGEIEAIALPRVMARRVRIVAPDGVAAIDVERADIDFDLGSFLSGDFVWHRAEIRDGIVRVSEDKLGRINMEETFRARPRASADGTAKPEKGDGELNMRTMVTSNMRLEIGGGELPRLRLVDIQGVMRVHVAPDGTTDIRFDDYRGFFAQGLPHGQLKFHAVKGHVQTGHKRLLRFEGKGLFEDAAVAFELDIFTEPKQRVKIDAYFPELTAEVLSTMGVGLWSKLLGSSLDIHVRHGK